MMMDKLPVRMISKRCISVLLGVCLFVTLIMQSQAVGQSAFITKNEPKEFSKAWKDQVLQNGVIAKAKFPIKHTLTLTCGDPGLIIQRIVIDWGGLKETYVGPAVLSLVQGVNPIFKDAFTSDPVPMVAGDTRINQGNRDRTIVQQSSDDTVDYAVALYGTITNK